MRFSDYKWIFTLLVFCALAILLLQVFWMNNYYQEKREQFRISVYAAMDQIIRKLNDREQLHIVKDRADSLLASHLKKHRWTVKQQHSNPLIDDTTTPGAAGTRIVVLDTSDSLIVTLADRSRQSDTQVERIKRILNRHPKAINRQTEVTVISSNISPNLSMADLDIKSSAQGDPLIPRELKEAEAQKFMERMITEVRILDSDEQNADTLYSLIGAVLRSKGIASPYEFSLRNIRGGKQDILAQSEKFDTTAFAFKGDLSQHRIFSTNNFLFLQFPGEDRIVFSNMKNSLILSLIFVLVIFFVFYQTVRLIQKQKKLSEIRNDFVNNMTHELKTPIATIGLAIDAMKHPAIRNDQARVDEYTGILREENDKLNRHVERVLQLSLLERRHEGLNVTSIDLRAMIGEVVAGFRLQAEAQKSTIENRTEAADLIIRGDSEQLKAVFSNLIDNSLKYAGERCRIEVTATEKNGLVEIVVKDNGPGVPKTEKEKIFDKFYRISTKTLHDVKGFGLGLSYVRTVVEMHGGSVEAAETDGGAAFIITLPKNGKAAAG